MFMFDSGDLEESRDDMHLQSVFPVISTSSKGLIHLCIQFSASSSPDPYHCFFKRHWERSEFSDV